MRPTKSMERHYSNADQDVVRMAFLPTSYIQLRRLPSRLRPGCLSSPRMQHSSGMSGRTWGKGTASSGASTAHRTTLNDFYSLESTQQDSHGGRPQSKQGPARPSSQGVHPGHGRSSKMSLVPAKAASREVHGTVPQHQFSTGPKAFSTFVYLPSDYDALKKKRSQEKLEHMSHMSGPSSFKTGIPSIPDKQGSFTHFQYEVDPYESRDEYHKPKQEQLMVQRVRKSFTPAGKFSAKDKKTQRKASGHILRERLIATLKADWSSSFVRCFEDNAGLVVCLFAEEQGGESDSFSGELARYMNMLIKTHPISNEFVLRRQSSRWGRQNNGFHEFVMVPPWVKMNTTESYMQMHLEQAARVTVQKGHSKREEA